MTDAAAEEIEAGKPKKRRTGLLFGFFWLLLLITLGLAGWLIEGLVLSDRLVAWWEGMSDAHASIYSQLIFFLAAAWAAVLVPLFFSDQMRSLDDAMAEARKQQREIGRSLADSAEESRKQFAELTKLQLAALGYLLSDLPIDQMDDSQKRAFVNTAWEQVEPKLEQALKRLHGKTRNWISAGAGNYRSSPWWGRVEESNALKDHFGDFKAIDTVKWAISRGAVPDRDQLMKVSNALKRISDFDPSNDAGDRPPQTDAEPSSN